MSKDCRDDVTVTVGICVKDSEMTIKAAALSLLNQTYNRQRMEVIVIDDGCKDQTIPLITRLFSIADQKIRLYSTGGGGLTMARQLVLDQACGYLLLYMDADMVFSREFVQQQVEFMESNPSVGAAQGLMKAIVSKAPVSELEDLSYSNQFEIGIHKTWRKNPEALGTGGTIFRVDAMRAAGGFDTRIKGAAEDADITARIKSAGYSLAMTEAKFEHEFKKTLKALWRQYTWYGFGMHYFYHRYGRRRTSGTMLIYFWPIAFGWGILRALLVFRSTHRCIAFFLPAYNFFRATAWWFGFFKAHVKGYGHEP